MRGALGVGGRAAYPRPTDVIGAGGGGGTETSLNADQGRRSYITADKSSRKYQAVGSVYPPAAYRPAFSDRRGVHPPTAVIKFRAERAAPDTIHSKLDFLKACSGTRS